MTANRFAEHMYIYAIIISFWRLYYYYYHQESLLIM